MTDASNRPMTSRQRESILRSLNKMVKKGQMTEAEATRLREATTPKRSMLQFVTCVSAALGSGLREPSKTAA